MNKNLSTRELFFERVWAIAQDGIDYLPEDAKKTIPRYLGGSPPPQIGYLGERYCGVVLCQLNPGIAPGGMENGGAAEQRLFQLLGQFGAERERPLAYRLFESVMGQTEKCMTGQAGDGRNAWPIYSNFVRKLLSQSGLSLNQIAYINIAHFPTEGNSKGLTESLINATLHRHTIHLLRALNPSALVVRYKRTLDSLPTDLFPKHRYVVGGLVPSNADISLAAQKVRSALER
jgi:hypothetical protein